MDLTCPCCGFQTTVPEEHLPPEGARARCHSCQRVSVYYSGGLVADDPTPVNPLEAVVAVAPARRPSPPSIPLAVPAPDPAAVARVADEGGSWRLRSPDGSEEGPLDLAEIKARIRTGDVWDDTETLAPGDDTWRRACELPSLQRWLALRKKSASVTAEAADLQGAVSCYKHSGVAGKWLCGSCGTITCDACVLKETYQRMEVHLCPKCRKHASHLTPSKVVVPFWKEIPQLLAYPIRDWAWVGVLICAAVSFGARIAVMGSWFLYLALYAYFIFIIRETAKGSRKIPNLGKVEDYKTDLMWPGLKTLAASLIVLLPCGYMAYKAVGAEMGVVAAESNLESETRRAEELAKHPPDEEPDDVATGQDATTSGGGAEMPFQLPPGMPGLTAFAGRAHGWKEDPPDVEGAQRQVDDARSHLVVTVVILALVLLYGIVIWPILLITVALFNTIAPAFQPQILLKIINEIRGEYAWCVLFVGICVVATSVVSVVTMALPLGMLIGSVASTYLMFIAFHVMGRTAEMAEQKLDWS